MIFETKLVNSVGVKRVMGRDELHNLVAEYFDQVYAEALKTRNLSKAKEIREIRKSLFVIEELASVRELVCELESTMSKPGPTHGAISVNTRFEFVAAIRSYREIWLKKVQGK